MQVERLDKHIDHMDRVVLVYPILQSFWQERQLGSVRAFNEASHPCPPSLRAAAGSSRVHAVQRLPPRSLPLPVLRRAAPPRRADIRSRHAAGGRRPDLLDQHRGGLQPAQRKDRFHLKPLRAPFEPSQHILAANARGERTIFGRARGSIEPEPLLQLRSYPIEEGSQFDRHRPAWCVDYVDRQRLRLTILKHHGELPGPHRCIHFVGHDPC